MHLPQRCSNSHQGQQRDGKRPSSDLASARLCANLTRLILFCESHRVSLEAVTQCDFLRQPHVLSEGSAPQGASFPSLGLCSWMSMQALDTALFYTGPALPALLPSPFIATPPIAASRKRPFCSPSRIANSMSDSAERSEAFRERWGSGESSATELAFSTSFLKSSRISEQSRIAMLSQASNKV